MVQAERCWAQWRRGRWVRWQCSEGGRAEGSLHLLSRDTGRELLRDERLRLLVRTPTRRQAVRQVLVPRVASKGVALGVRVPKPEHPAEVLFGSDLLTARRIEISVLDCVQAGAGKRRPRSLTYGRGVTQTGE